MAEYFVRWNYSSSLGGPWIEGQTVEVDEAMAEQINRDSPSVLMLVDGMTGAPDEREYKCPYCGETFLGGATYARHKPQCAEQHARENEAMSSETFRALIVK